MNHYRVNEGLKIQEGWSNKRSYDLAMTQSSRDSFPFYLTKILEARDSNPTPYGTLLLRRVSNLKLSSPKAPRAVTKNKSKLARSSLFVRKFNRFPLDFSSNQGEILSLLNLVNKKKKTKLRNIQPSNVKRIAHDRSITGTTNLLTPELW